MSTYRLFPSTDGPATPVDFGTGFEFVSATGFWVTHETIYFERSIMGCGRRCRSIPA